MANKTGLLLAFSLLSLAPYHAISLQQNPEQEFTVFRHLALGEALPNLELLDPSGKGLVLEGAGEKPSIIAFLRPDQEASLQLLAFLEKFALDKSAPDVRTVVVGMKGRRGPSWGELGKGLPRKVQLSLDAGTVSQVLGIIVLPSVAILDVQGNLFSAQVLFDEDIGNRIHTDLELLANGHASPLNASEQAQRKFLDFGQKAKAMEMAGELEKALVLRRSQTDLSVQPGAAYFHLGRVEFLLGRFSAAIDHLQTSIMADSTISARLWLGRAMLRDGKLENAKVLLQEVLPLAPEKGLVHRELAEIFQREGKMDQALEQMRAALAALGASVSGEVDGRE